MNRRPLHLRFRATVAIATALVAFVPTTAWPQAAGLDFDFAYEVSGDVEAAPVQVFDDGRRTFFRFNDPPPGELLVMVEAARGVITVRSTRSGPFTVVDGVASRYRLVVAGHRAAVTYSGLEAKQAVASTTPEQDRLPTPVVSPSAKAASDPGASGPPAAAGTTWRLRRGQALHLQLRDWATAAGWQLEWRLGRSWLVPADTEFAGTFDQAVERVVLGLADEGKAVRLKIWEGNHVAEISEYPR